MEVGLIQKLKVSRISDYGLYLEDEEKNEVLLPNRFVSLEWKVGDEIEVFVYHDSEDRIVATTMHPNILRGECAYLKIVDKNIHGAFLDWGVAGKDLFLPNRNQHGAVVVGKHCTVYLYVDERTGRCVATQKFKEWVNNDDVVTVTPGQEVNILIVSESPLGYRCIVENRHWGMIYKNQIFKPVSLGDKCRAFVHRVTEDNRIDLSLQRNGLRQVKDSSELLYSKIEEAGGYLELSDSSSPEDIEQQLEMSKKLFKRSLGILLSHNRVVKDGDGIRIIQQKR